MNLPRVYYTLPELAEKWKRSESDLLQMAAAGELELSVKYRGWALDQTTGHILPVKSHVQLYPQGVEALQDGITKVDGASLRGNSVMIPTDEPSLNRLKCWASEFDSLLPFVEVTPLEIKRLGDLRILPAEAERMEAKFPELAGRNETSAETVDQARNGTAGQSGPPPLDPMKAIPGGWKGIAGELGKTPGYAKKYCKNNGIRVEHDKAGKPWTTPEEIARSRLIK